MKRVLVVEDETSIRELIALNLRMAGYEVLEAPTAERGLELLSAQRCDAAVLDVMLPGMNGFSLCETIRRDDSAIGIIILGWGVVQVGMSVQSHDASQRTQGFLCLFGGLLIAFAKEILTLIAG